MYQNIFEIFTRDNAYKKWISYCLDHFANETRTTASKIILCDVFVVPDWLFVNSFAINQLCRSYGCKAVTFGNLPRKLRESNIYSSFGVKDHLQVHLNSISLRKRHKSLFKVVKNEIKSKEDLFNFKAGGVHIGVEIYESILRTGVSTVDINSFITWQNIYIGLEYYVYFDELYSANKIQALVLSHDNYIYMGVPAKVGYKYNIPSYLFNAREFICLTRPNQLSERLKFLPQYFENLTDFDKVKAKEWSEAQLEKRLRGQIGVEMAYQQKSAFTFENIESQVLNNGKTGVVVATHEFYDNPHAYGNLLFMDFYEWLIFLGELSKKTDYNWYLKPHRDVVPGEITQLEEICRTYPKFILLKQDYTFHQLEEEGVKFALTCYGSIGHELPFLGFTVINAGNNPHMAYDFNLHPGTVQEYRDLLMNLEDISLVINKEDIFEFFYTYNKIIYSSDFTIDKYFPAQENLTGNVYTDFLKIVLPFQKEIDEKLSNFINSKKTYSFLLSLPLKSINTLVL